MSKWEYLIIDSASGTLGGGVWVISPDGEKKKLAGASDLTYINKLLNFYGEMGWELTAFNREMLSQGSRAAWALKRLKTNKVE